jgi:hypothetical protein
MEDFAQQLADSFADPQRELELLDEAISVIGGLDPMSFSFRYPVSTAGELTPNPPQLDPAGAWSYRNSPD